METEYLLTGYGHTVVNVLQEYLLKDPRISYAGYLEDHPLIKDIRLKVISNSTDNNKIIIDSIDNIINDLDKLLIMYTSTANERSE